MLQEHPIEDEKVLFCDNLDAQTTQSFLNLLREANCFRYLQPPETTDAIQAVDNGLGRLTKFLVGKQFDDWMDEGDNLQKWEDGRLQQVRNASSSQSGLAKHGRLCLNLESTIQISFLSTQVAC